MENPCSTSDCPCLTRKSPKWYMYMYRTTTLKNCVTNFVTKLIDPHRLSVEVGKFLKRFSVDHFIKFTQNCTTFCFDESFAIIIERLENTPWIEKFRTRGEIIGDLLVCKTFLVNLLINITRTLSFVTIIRHKSFLLWLVFFRLSLISDLEKLSAENS